MNQDKLKPGQRVSLAQILEAERNRKESKKEPKKTTRKTAVKKEAE